MKRHCCLRSSAGSPSSSLVPSVSGYFRGRGAGAASKDIFGQYTTAAVRTDMYRDTLDLTLRRRHMAASPPPRGECAPASVCFFSRRSSSSSRPLSPDRLFSLSTFLSPQASSCRVSGCICVFASRAPRLLCPSPMLFLSFFLFSSLPRTG